MKKLLIGMPKWYAILLGVLYVLPIPIPLVYSVVVLLSQGILIFLSSFLPGTLLSYMGSIPFFCMYYAVITFFHAVLDVFFVFRITVRRKAVTLLLALICSGALFVSSMLVIHLIEADENLYSFIALLSMMFSFGAMLATLIVRSVILRLKKAVKPC